MNEAVVFVPEAIELLFAARCTTAFGVNAAFAGRLIVDVDWLLACPLVYTPLEATLAIVHKSQCQLGKQSKCGVDCKRSESE